MALSDKDKLEKLQSKLFEKENEARDLRSQVQEIYDLRYKSLKRK